MSSEKFKSKQQDTITHLLEQPKYRTPNTDEDVGPDKLTFILFSQFIVGGSAKWHRHLGR